MKENIIQEKSFRFACDSIREYKLFRNTYKEFVIAKQFVRASTSIGANIEEAIQASSKKDFINKMNISLKESYETRFWLKIIDSEYSLVNRKLLDDVNSIISILVKIIKTSKANL